MEFNIEFDVYSTSAKGFVAKLLDYDRGIYISGFKLITSAKDEGEILIFPPSNSVKGKYIDVLELAKKDNPYYEAMLIEATKAIDQYKASDFTEDVSEDNIKPVTVDDLGKAWG